MSRMGKVWSYGALKVTIGRVRPGGIIEKDGGLFLSEDFLKGMDLQSKAKN